MDGRAQRVGDLAMLGMFALVGLLVIKVECSISSAVVSPVQGSLQPGLGPILAMGGSQVPSVVRPRPGLFHSCDPDPGFIRLDPRHPVRVLHARPSLHQPTRPGLFASNLPQPGSSPPEYVSPSRFRLGRFTIASMVKDTPL